MLTIRNMTAIVAVLLLMGLAIVLTGCGARTSCNVQAGVGCDVRSSNSECAGLFLSSADFNDRSVL